MVFWRWGFNGSKEIFCPCYIFHPYWFGRDQALLGIVCALAGLVGSFHLPLLVCALGAHTCPRLRTGEEPKKSSPVSRAAYDMADGLLCFFFFHFHHSILG